MSPTLKTHLNNALTSGRLSLLTAGRMLAARHGLDGLSRPDLTRLLAGKGDHVFTPEGRQTTSDFAELLDSTIERFVVSAFESYKPSWPAWLATQEVETLTARAVRLDPPASLPTIAEGDEYEPVNASA